MNNKGFTMVELLIAVALLTIITLGLAEFSMNILNVSAKHSRQIENASGSRFSSERITEAIKKAGYIYPKNITVNLYIDDLIDLNTLEHQNSYTVNTNEAIALLLPNIEGLDTEDYRYYTAIVYFIGKNPKTGKYDLFEFTTYYTQHWEKNVIPANTTNSFTGNITVLATNVDKDNCNLDYFLNYNNGVTDYDLLGEVGDASISDYDALIKGIDWQIILNNESKQNFYIKGLSKNVPRT